MPFAFLSSYLTVIIKSEVSQFLLTSLQKFK